jgi:hypothetical protein
MFADRSATFVDGFLRSSAPGFISGLAPEVQTSGKRSIEPGAEKREAMKIKNKLLNPFALIFQGFLAGAVLFYSTAPEQPPAQPLSSGMQSAAVQQISEI